MQQTTTLKLNKPDKGTFDWDVPINANWDTLDQLGTNVNTVAVIVNNNQNAINNINTALNSKVSTNVDNLSATGKANLVYWNLLNYGAEVTISGWTGDSGSPSTTFTAPKAGVIVPYLYSHGVDGTAAYIAGKEIANIKGGQTWAGAFPINKGEQLTSNRHFWLGSIKFYPYKGV